MRSDSDESLHQAVYRLRETLGRIQEALPERGTPSARRLGPVVGWLHDGLEALSDAADSLARDPSLPTDPMRSVRWLVAVAATLLWMEDTASAAGIEWPADALSVRPELRDRIREVVSTPEPGFARAA